MFDNNNGNDPNTLIQFGLFILALLTFIFSFCK